MVVAFAALAVMWLVIAVAVAVIAAQRFRLAQQVLDAAQANARLLELMPARPLVVRPGQQVEADEKLVRELGLKASPKTLGELAGNDSGIVPDDLEALVAEVEAAQASAGRFSRKVRVHRSARVFNVLGGPAGGDEPPGTLLLWFVDTSAGEEERARLALRLRQTEGALSSLTHLIEAAPF